MAQIEGARAKQPARGGPGTTLPILVLTLRQFIGGKAIRIVALGSLLPALFSMIFALDSGGITALEFMNGLFIEFIGPTVIPISILILATNAVGNEIEDRTMVYLVLKPISRLRIILEKFGGVVIASTLLLWEGTLLAFIVAMRGDAGDNLDQLLAMAVAIVVAVLGYGALFLAISLLVPRALLAGILYSLLWETTFARFIPGVRLVSVRHFVLSVYGRLLDRPDLLIADAIQLAPAVLTVLVLAAGSLGLATWRLRTMNLE